MKRISSLASEYLTLFSPNLPSGVLETSREPLFFRKLENNFLIPPAELENGRGGSVVYFSLYYIKL